MVPITHIPVKFSFVVLWLGLLTGSLAFTPTQAIGISSGIGDVPQGNQDNTAYANSFRTNHVTNVFATSQLTSCYTPEVPYFTNNGPNDGYDGMSPCGSGSQTGEDPGPYPSQSGSNPGYPAGTAMLVKDHSESDLQVDPTNPSHLIGSSKWVVSAEGYNHLNGFYESFDGGRTWPAQGHIPGYEGWTDNTDPDGAFDGYGNYYAVILPYQFFYNKDGSHNFQKNSNREPNPALAAEAISVAVRPKGSTAANQWITTHKGQPDLVASYDSLGREPDKQWIAIDNHPSSPHYNTIYVAWVVLSFSGTTAKVYLSTAQALPDGTHTDWTPAQSLPTVSGTAYDHCPMIRIDPSGTVWVAVAHFPSAQQRSTSEVDLDYSRDGGKTWEGPLTVEENIVTPPAVYANTTFRFGSLMNLGIGSHLSAQGRYPLYMTWEDASAGVSNILLSVSYDGGQSWSPPIQVNDNLLPVDEFQPVVAVAANDTVSVAFYDRRLACSTAGTQEASAAGLALDQSNPNYTGRLPPYGVANYCVNGSIQFYKADLTPIGHNIRLTGHTWDPQLNALHPSSASNNSVTFIGDYFPNVISGATDVVSLVTTYNDGSNPRYRQQQVIATIKLP
jgi:hypothetical protein